MKKVIKKICILLIPIVMLIGIIVIVDPYFHYHKPIAGISYIIDNERYQNDGILKHFDYDAIITGTSFDENIKTSEVDKLFGVKSIKTAYSGGYFPEIARGIRQSYKTGHNPKIIMMSLGYNNYILQDKNYWGNEDFEYPDYLYDNNFFNDWKYFFNTKVLELIIKSIENTIKGISMTSFDEYSNWKSEWTFGKEAVLRLYNMNSPFINDKFTGDYEKIIKENLSENIVSIAKEHKDTTFYLYFPPFNIVYWREKVLNGELEKVIELLKISIEELVDEDNIKLFYFAADTDITIDFDNYKDYVHYDEWVNSYMIKAMRKNEKLLTKNNYLYYLNKTKQFYTSYDYASMFK